MSVYMSVQIRVRPITFFWFDIGLPYLAHGCITMRQCVVYIHNPKRTFTFDLKVEFIGFMTWPCVRVTTFLSFDIAMLCLARVTSVSPWYGVSRTFMTWPLTSFSKFYFYQEFEPGKIVLHIGVSPWDKFCVHSWPLYGLDLWPICGWLSLVSFTHSF